MRGGLLMAPWSYKLGVKSRTALVQKLSPLGVPAAMENEEPAA